MRRATTLILDDITAQRGLIQTWHRAAPALR
jgi:hypothetical protein